MKTNYTDARKVDIYMYNSGNTTAFWFINSTLTRSALNDKVRTINNESAIKNGTTTNSGGSSIGYAGLVADTRDKIINNLHPEVCRIKIPGTGGSADLKYQVPVYQKVNGIQQVTDWKVLTSVTWNF